MSNVFIFTDEQLLAHVNASNESEVAAAFWDLLDALPISSSSTWARAVNNWAIVFNLQVRLKHDSLLSVSNDGVCTWRVYEDS